MAITAALWALALGAAPAQGTCLDDTPATAPQGALTLEQCINLAMSNNLQVKQKDIERQQQEVSLSTERNRRLPDLNAGAQQNWSFGRGLTSQNTYSDTNTASTSLSLTTSVPLFSGFEISHSIKLGRLNLEAATADLDAMRDDIRRQVAQAYVQVLYDDELADVARRQVSIDSLHVYRLQETFRSGKASGAEVAQQEATLAQSRLTLTQACNNRAIDLLQLSQLLELPSPEGFDIVRPDTSAITPLSATLPLPQQIMEQAMESRAEVRAEHLRLQGTEQSIMIARSALYPKLSLQAGLGTNYYTTSGFPADVFGTQMRNNFSQFVGLNLSIPLFNRFATRNSIRTAKLNRTLQQLRLDDTRKALFKEIQQAYYNALTARAKYASSQQAMHSQEKAFTLVEGKYEYGKATITEFNEAKANLLKAQSDMAGAKYEFMFQRSLLLFYGNGGMRF